MKTFLTRRFVAHARPVSVVVVVVVVVVVAMLFAGALATVPLGDATAQGPPGERGGPPQGPPPSAGVADFADQIGLDEATAQAIAEIEQTSRHEDRAMRLELDVLHAELRRLLGDEAPDEAAVMRKAEEIGTLEMRSHQNRLRTMMRVRALLTPEQRDALVRIHEERKRERGRMRGRPRDREAGPGPGRFGPPPHGP